MRRKSKSFYLHTTFKKCYHNLCDFRNNFIEGTAKWRKNWDGNFSLPLSISWSSSLSISPENIRKPYVLFSGGIERDPWHDMG